VKSRRPRRRSQRPLAALLRAYWLLGVVLVGILVWAAWTTAALPVFHLRSLAITGLNHVSKDEVLQRASIDPHANVWLLDRSAMRQRIETIPYVDTARIHVRLPANVWIEIVERIPQACVRDGAGHTLAVDDELRVLEDACVQLPVTYVLPAVLPARPGTFLRDAGLVTLAADARAIDGGTDRYRTFAFDTYGELEATLQDGIVVRFGDDGDLDRKEQLVEPILAELGPRAGNVRTVDLRAPATPVVEYRH